LNLKASHFQQLLRGKRTLIFKENDQVEVINTDLERTQVKVLNRKVKLDYAGLKAVLCAITSSLLEQSLDYY